MPQTPTEGPDVALRDVVVDLEVGLPGIVDAAGVTGVLVRVAGEIREGIQIDQTLARRVKARAGNHVSRKRVTSVSRQS